MSSPEVFYACRWLIRDTFRQSLANRVFWVLLAANGIVILFCLGISVEHGEPLKVKDDLALDRPGVTKERPIIGHLYLAYGAWRLPLTRDARGDYGKATVHFILLAMGEGVIGILGTLLALVLTAGFVPEFLQPANATVLLSKPTPRWVLLLGKYLGVMTMLGVQVGIFVIGTWLAVGLRTGYWVSAYLWGLPLLLVQVAAIYGFSMFLGVCTGSTLASVIGSVLFWFMCWGLNCGRHLLVANEDELPRQSGLLRGLTEAAYWIMPKPLDLGMILHRAVDASQGVAQLRKVEELGAFYPEMSVLTALAFAILMVILSAQQLASNDY